MTSTAGFLCIDAGTQSLRASVVNRRGEIIAYQKEEFDEPYAQQSGWAEYPVDNFWTALVNTARAAVSQAKSHNIKIKAVGVTCQRSTVINLDNAGNPMRPAILWSDQRRVQQVPEINGLVGLGMKLIGVHKTVKHFQHEAEINWLTHNQADIWKRTQKFLFLSGYFTYRLTGNFVDSVANQVGYVPFDYKKQRWTKRSQWQWQALKGLEPHHLPALQPVGSILGTLQLPVATEIDVPENTPIVACATDKACEVLGSGCIDPTMACLSFGTAATVNVTTKKYLEIERFLPAYPTIDGQYLCEVQTHRGFWLVNWFKNEFASIEVRKAHRQSITPESLFEHLLTQTPPGADGLIAQPYWSPGIRVPGPEARGALIGFNSTHTRAHVYRALLEGVAYSLRDGLNKIERKTKTAVSTLRVAGGGAQSDQILQMTANIFALPVERNQEFEASTIGAAICCAVACGIYSDTTSAVNHMTKTRQRFDPNPDVAKMYQRVFKDIYQPMYGQLKPLYLNMLNHRYDCKDHITANE